MKKILRLGFSVILLLLLGFVGFLLVREETIVLNDLELLESESRVVPWGVALVNPHGHSEIGARTVRVAILDDGVYANHPDLEGRVVAQYNVMAEAGGALSYDASHGTAVAGIIAAVNNGTGIVGVSQNVELYSIIISTADGRVNRQDFINGIEWAIENDIDIINASLGFLRDSDDLKEAVERAINHGIVVLAASGNTNGLNALFPARHVDVISVGSINAANQLSAISAIGKIDFVAPGVDVLSLTPGGGYELFEGSSFAVAFVTGIVAEYLAHNDVARNEYRQSVIFDYLLSISRPLNDSKERVGNGVPIIPER